MSNFDLRTPIGLFFALIGLSLAIYGSITEKAMYARSLNININLNWGILLLVFGALMLFFAWRGKSST